MSFAKTTILGRCAADPEVRTTNSGTTVVRVSVAHTRRVKRGEKWDEEVSFTDCILWGKRGEAFVKFHSKGSSCFLHGELVQNTWEKDGTKHYRHVLEGCEWHFTGDAKKEESSVFGSEDDSPF